MADGIYIGMAGAAARANQLEAISDNLANAQTPGFKKAEPTFQALLAAGGSREQAFPVAVATAVDLAPGATLRTEEKLDVVPEDGAFLAVQHQGGVAFTRAGHLRVGGDGRLLAGEAAVLDRDGLPLVVPEHRRHQAPVIRPDGSVWAGEERVGRLATFRLHGPLDRLGGTLLRPGEGGTAVATEAALRVGELELSNASPLSCAVQLVSAQRHFESAMQSIQTYRRLDERMSELGKVR